MHQFFFDSSPRRGVQGKGPIEDLSLFAGSNILAPFSGNHILTRCWALPGVYSKPRGPHASSTIRLHMITKAIGPARSRPRTRSSFQCSCTLASRTLSYLGNRVGSAYNGSMHLGPVSNARAELRPSLMTRCDKMFYNLQMRFKISI